MKDDGTQGRIAAVGIDTVSFAWRPDDEALWAAMAWSASNGILSAPAGTGWPPTMPASRVEPKRVIAQPGGAFMLKDPVRAARWIVQPKHRLIYCEGRAAAILSGDLKTRSLAPASCLPRAADLAAASFEMVAAPSAGVLTDGVACVRRLDLAADLRFDPELAAYGRAILEALAALDPGRRRKSCIWIADGQVETVTTFKRRRDGGGGQMVGRCYAKDRERGLAAPTGSWLRFEHETRYAKADQQPASEVATADLGARWAEGFEHIADLDRAVEVAPASVVQERIIQSAESGDLSRETAERLLGAVAIMERRGPRWWREVGASERTGRRRAEELAEHGFVLARHGGASAAQLDLAGLIGRIRSRW